MTRTLIIALFVAGATAGAWLALAARTPARKADDTARAGKSSRPIPWRGLAIQLTDGPEALPAQKALIDEVAALGANTILMAVHGYMEHARSQAIYVDARRAPSAEQLSELVRYARRRELRVIAMPVVLLSHPRGSEWRGVIDPPDWDQWWRQYRDFVLYYANAAASADAEAFILGSELISTEKFTDEWRRVIAAVRRRMPDTRLGYSANWDHYEPVGFWDDLDFVGMTSYYRLADEPAPPVEDIVRKWEPIVERIRRWQRRAGKPIVFTEVGWCSQEGAAIAPWNYYRHQKATRAGHEEQRRLYEAFLQAWGDVPGVQGVIWWEWKRPGGPDDYGYSPRGKPAEVVLRRWFRELSPTTRPASQPAD